MNENPGGEQHVHAPMSTQANGPCLGCRTQKALALYDCLRKHGMCGSCIEAAQHGRIPVTGEMLKLLQDAPVIDVNSGSNGLLESNLTKATQALGNPVA